MPPTYLIILIRACDVICLWQRAGFIRHEFRRGYVKLDRPVNHIKRSRKIRLRLSVPGT